MVKHKRRKSSRNPAGLVEEARYIVRRAQQNEGRIVVHDTLVFFSTETGDAWMLDPADSLALCLARTGEKEPYAIHETSTSYAVEWNARYQIDGDRFIVLNNSGQLRTILGYPLDQIWQAIARASKA